MAQERHELAVAVIGGSARAGRFGPAVVAWTADQAGRRDDMVADVVDVADAELPWDMGGYGADPTPGPLAPRLEAADAFVVVTPEYNHSYPAALKNLIDWHRREWQAKPVAFVSYGALSGGLRAVEHLRGVFAELHAVTVRDTVSFQNAWERFDAAGRPVETEGCERAAKTMLDQLAWWGHALRDARAARPYAA
ncbi:NADPH-dependent FMN reductase [Streptomyces millisiae]|uniref:NAD(P)H-dependent oxidoreductase n=1 Tax=Streptomyces millisiae TaxID=3075542 RepID=A0ABU2LSB0_9ACTN|nr:NAD(P)H-dependent oxidoreductase [Streptomyces sp. DSM 44918]MDT0320431.1 NAD(P)H-dependent oxidoreductase [Streptomyces sp. DSM 44918]